MFHTLVVIKLLLTRATYHVISYINTSSYCTQPTFIFMVLLARENDVSQIGNLYAKVIRTSDITFQT